MEREGEKACDLVFFYKTSALHNAKSEEKKKEEREKNSILFFAKQKGVTSRYSTTRGLEVSLKLGGMSKSEVCRALFDAEKVFQIFRMYIYMLHKLSSRLIWLDDWLDV